MSNIFTALTHSQHALDGLTGTDDAGLRRSITEAVYSSRSHKSWAENQASRQGLNFAEKLFGLGKPTNNAGDGLDVIESPVARLDRKSLSIVAQLQEQLGNNKYAVRKPIVRPDGVRNEAAMAAAQQQAAQSAAKTPEKPAGLSSGAEAVSQATTNVPPAAAKEVTASTIPAPTMEQLSKRHGSLQAEPVTQAHSGTVRGAIKREFRTSPSYETLAKEHKDVLHHKINGLKEESFLQKNDPALGALSAQFESGKAGIAAIGYDRVGGTSYGKYQLSSRAGTMRRFIGYLKEHEPQWADRLAQSGRANTRGRRGTMPNTWRQIAKENPVRFEKLQEDFIMRTNYHPAKQSIQAATKIDVANHSLVLQDVLHSTAVQHGPGGASRIFIRAIRRTKSTEANMREEALIEEIYRNRKQNFGSSSRSVRRAVRARLTAEMDMAIDLLRQNIMVAKKDARIS